MKKLTAVLLLLCCCAHAPPPANPFPEGRSLRLGQGELTPYPGWLLEDTEHARREWVNERNAGTLEAAKSQVLLSPAVLAAVIAGCLAVGAAAGAGAAVAAQPKR